MADAAKRNGNGGPAGPDLETLPIGEVLTSLKTDPDKGLSDEEARGRLSTYGPNALPEKHESFARKVLNYFIGPIAFMIEAAALVSAFLGRWDDFAIIFGLLIFNAALELWQDRKGVECAGSPEAKPCAPGDGAQGRDFPDGGCGGARARRHGADPSRGDRACGP
ncbi:cation-transporting P-type ATPase [uncultured Roseibium sp.]|uniref:cation-transporting P-type ATPase n=1 Tax=uncultured Roseibium sp. TaxID=1936171 RepID=UPI003216C235